jgi:hypothetical protein
VTSFDAMVAALSSLSDEAAAKFNQQASTAAALAASMSDAITAMREAAALNEEMAEKYVQQTLMLDAATGQLVDGWSCDREKYWELRFGVNRCGLQHCALLDQMPVFAVLWQHAQHMCTLHEHSRYGHGIQTCL